MLDFSHIVKASPIPNSALSNLGNLKILSLSSCGLIGPIPTSFSNLVSLNSLSLDNNSLSGEIPSSLGSLPNLGELNLSQNQLSGKLSFPDEFISRLGKRLDVKGNNGLCVVKSNAQNVVALSRDVR